MQIIVTGKPQKVPLSLCKEAIRYFGSILLPKRVYKKLTIRLIFSADLKDSADCQWLSTNSFKISIKKRMGVRNMLTGLAHEMVHIKQWSTGELVHHRGSKIKWQGKIIDTAIDDDINYWLNYPWEIDARGRELGLYKVFKLENSRAVYRK